MTDEKSQFNRDGWKEVAIHSSVQIAGKQYRNMREWQRPCAVCDAPFSAFERADADGPNSRFSNRTCDAHRGLKAAFEKEYLAWSGTSIVAGPAIVGGSGVTVGGIAATNLTAQQVVNGLKEECDGWIADNKELRVEIEILKAEIRRLKADNAVLLKSKFPPSRTPW